MPKKNSATCKGEEPRLPSRKLGKKPIQQEIEVVPLGCVEDEWGSKVFGGKGMLLEVS